jgi:AcrR family transcriptional regulator
MQASDKKKIILKIADKMFAHYGYRKTTMDDIARACKMAKSSLYYYFQNKDEIFAVVIRQDSVIFREKLNAAVNSASSPIDKIVAYVYARLKHLRDLTNYYTTLTDEYLELYYSIEEIRNEFYIYEKHTLINLLQSGIEENIFIIPDPDLTARMISIIIKGLEYPLLISRSDIDLENEIPKLLNILFDGIKNNNPE